MQIGWSCIVERRDISIRSEKQVARINHNINSGGLGILRIPKSPMRNSETDSVAWQTAGVLRRFPDMLHMSRPGTTENEKDEFEGRTTD